MQHRNAYQPPNTPSFTIESASSTRSSPTSTHPPPPPAPLRSNGSMNGAGDYFSPPKGTGDKDQDRNKDKLPIAFPPSQRSPTGTRFQLQPHHSHPAHSNESSSVHLPLLADDDEDDDRRDANHSPHRHLRSPPSPSPISHSGHPHHAHAAARRRTVSSSSWVASIATTRTRIHPLVLVPVFVLGIVFSMTFVSSPREYDKMGRSAMTSLKSLGSGHWTTSAGSHSSSPNYTLHSSGHLFLSPSSLYSPAGAHDSRSDHSLRHPIHELILNASVTWNEKLSRQSRNLTEAVVEYKRRFDGRNPPKGFDKWFEFAQANDVVLIDEFDQTFRDVEMFWSLPPRVIRERAEKLQLDQSTFTMVINNDRSRKGGKKTKGDDSGDEVEIVGAHAKDGRAKDQKELMKRWAKYVEGSKRRDGKGFDGVNITMAAHDGPSVMMDEKSRNRHLEAARSGKYLKEDEYEEVDEDAALWGFPLACPVNSRLRRAYDGLEIDNLPKGPSFVADHVQTMNMCENPEWQYLHGFTSWPGMRPQILRPLFSFAKTSLHSDILLTPLEQYWDREPWDPKWEDKPYNKAVWRGSTTGVWFDRGTWWRSSQRVRLWFMGKDKTGVKNVRFSTEGVETRLGVESLVEKRVPTLDLIDRYVDFAFTGREGQCSVEDGSCDAVRKLFDFQPTFGWNEANEYKYMLDLDGNAWSGRFHRLLSTNSAVLKSTIFPEWYAGWIQPWVHYIPIKIDYTDLFDVMAFFSGDLDGQNHHEHLAKQIADNGKDYTERFWRYEDMEAYFFRLTLEWARVSAEDRESMDYIHPGL